MVINILGGQGGSTHLGERGGEGGGLVYGRMRR
jgi:hypothetical protein